MNLGGRATLAVPLIALVVAAYAATYSVATEPSNSLIKGWSLAQTVFSYAIIFALPVGFILAIPAVLFGDRLPKPRLVWLSTIGAAVGAVFGLIIFSSPGSSVGEIVALFASIGLICASLWWLLVERYRQDPIFDA